MSHEDSDNLEIDTREHDPSKPIGPDNPCPLSHAGRRALQEAGIEEAKDGGWADPWRKIRKQTFRPGQSGNPSGRPKDTRSMADRMRSMIRSDPTKLKFVKEVVDALDLPDDFLEGADVGDIMALVGLFNAFKGSTAHYSMILDRIDGRPANSDAAGNEADDAAARVREALSEMEKSNTESLVKPNKTLDGGE